ncbi:alpha/beta hydrolase [Novosphingobium sp. 9U]|uniref:alpha/beta hydrolase n=1 Tax=Novosphingobium sp. 9U TaxID=2653158 RepID=UPI0012F353A5|nr:alpha/beta hydrolase [Novosphingobium sp. 9U]VWX53283.1 Alpha/beta hydrolase [Novosphingobium sp. 9U]
MNRRMLWIMAAPVLAVMAWFSEGPIRLALYQPTAANLAYGKASPAQKLDIYLPEHTPGPYPVLVFIHGGAFEIGDKREASAAFVQRAQRVTDAGMAFVSINYRMSGEAPFPAAVADTRSALRWLRAHAGRYHLDPGRVAVWGQSAGANLALIAGLADRVPLFEDRTIAPEASARVSAIVAMFPPTDFLRIDDQLKRTRCPAQDRFHDDPQSAESRYLGAPVRSVPGRAAAANPVSYVTAAAPPMLIQHGTADCVVPPGQSVLMQEAARRAGARSTLMLLRDAEHMDPAFDTAQNTAVVLGFVRRAFARPLT